MAATVTELRERLDTINRAIHSGARDVSYSTAGDGTERTVFGSLDEMLRARADIERQIAGNPARARQGAARFSRGL